MERSTRHGSGERIEGVEPVPLGEFAGEYLAGRESKAAATQRADRITLRKLIDHFGPRRDIRTIRVHSPCC